MTWVDLGDLGHLGCLTPIATSLQCLPSALRKEDNQCPPLRYARKTSGQCCTSDNQ
ncbi:hypothetical protein DPMN_095645 [Dreissena polymorpha]|uniref:Uncharacterized protein n=1 Tax=Dreissena polymorpha TaxID=45954 RepID=A0A9D4R3R9_DREPO|nr:hypothetical protein DPMN_095645 [Dreissena polymorpha]